MTVPTLKVEVNFSSGASFANTMVLGTGILDLDALGDAQSVVVDISDQIQSVEIRRGRNPLADQFQAGTLTVRLRDELGLWNPQNTGSPYYPLQPLRKIRVMATSGTLRYLFSGYTTGYQYTQARLTGEVSYTTITAVDAMNLWNLSQIAGVTGQTAGELSGARVNKILDAINWPNSMRDIDAGLTTLQLTPSDIQSALNALIVCQLSEYGAMYADVQGNAVFRDRQFTQTSVGGTPTAFDDTGTDIQYTNAQWVLNDDLIFNQANITAIGLAKQTAENQASIDQYFLHSYNQQNLLMETTTEALNYAQAYVASRAETTVRCDSITLDLYTPNYTAGIAAALDLDFFDPITVTQAQPNATNLTKTLQIFGIAHSITPNSWRTTFSTQEPIIDSFILNNTLGYGELDVSKLGY